ncbi:2-dehydropantoate 2-reductase [Lysinibacillus sp. 54212]|uniref:2-dehydropantoate 2-reductase n=1 Tax=Lysinibacillus sp. 54212 TaxID=3119829 RepID=UPI002FC5C3E9
MSVQIIGGGAVGLLVASFLAEQNVSVTIITRREEQASSLNEGGLYRNNIDGSTINVEVVASTAPVSQASLVIIATKYTELHAIYPMLKKLSPDVPLLFLQNGLAHYEEALLLPQRHIAFCSAQFGALKENDNTVSHRGIGVLKTAIERGDEGRFSILKEMNQKNFPVTFEGNAEQILFEKVLLNCFINPLTAILKVKNGELVSNPNALKLLHALYNELMHAFPYMQKIFPFEEVERLCVQTAENTSSMLADRLAGRKTEIETIVGAVLKKAGKKGHAIPTLETLYGLIKAMEESGESS